MNLDTDLHSIQEVRDSLQVAKKAQLILEAMSQEQIDVIVERMAQAAQREAGRLGQLAHEETGFGNPEDKRIKNIFASKTVYDHIKGMRTVGIIHRDEVNRVWEVAQPVGIVAGIIPSTNPTSTVIFKALIAIKARNAIVFSPHPSAKGCCLETTRVLMSAALEAGAPEGILYCLQRPTLEATKELMTHKLTDLILATGGTGMIKAAYSSGKPAYGVGPGNVPVYVHPSASPEQVAEHIIRSKTFDNGTICASEQALITDKSIREKLLSELKKRGAYVLNPDEKKKVAAIIMVGGSLNAKVVGRSAKAIAQLAGIDVPAGTIMLLAEESEVGKDYPFSVEKLSPILALYTVNDWREGCKLCVRLLELGGLGHSLGLHCEDQQIIEAFALEKPASRIIINAGTTFGGIGATTGIPPSLTLGCGSFGNNITSDNIGPKHLLNIKRVAFGIRDLKEVTAESNVEPGMITETEDRVKKLNLPISREEVMQIVKQVLMEFKG
ncbi:MAG: acetaldehyde dehydrogenase (acetylating) [Paenibacillaceae bacterium]